MNPRIVLALAGLAAAAFTGGQAAYAEECLSANGYGVCKEGDPDAVVYPSGTETLRTPVEVCYLLSCMPAGTPIVSYPEYSYTLWAPSVRICLPNAALTPGAC